MHISFMEYLVDPETKEFLKLIPIKQEGEFIIEGTLASSKNSYPIVRGIPRFAGYSEDSYTKSFGYQWNKWSRVQFESQNVDRPMEGHTLNMWQKITAIDSKDLSGATILDFGCGPGRFIEVLRMKNAKAIGIDLSAAVEAAGQIFKNDPNVLICQADALNSPIKPQSVDGAYSIGVLHHTPDPRKGFYDMIQSVKPGGWAALAVYGKGGYYDFITVSLYRKLFKLLWPLFKHYPPLLYSYIAAYIFRPISYVPIIGLLVRALFPFVRLPDVRWSLLDTFDSVTPSYQSAHESYEVFRWFHDAGLTDIAPSDWGFTSYHGTKP